MANLIGGPSIIDWSTTSLVGTGSSSGVGGAGISGPGGTVLALALETAYRATTLIADPVSPLYRTWDADPTTAERAGRTRYAPAGTLSDTLFATVVGFTRASTATDFDSTGSLVAIASGAPRLGYNPTTLAPAGLLIEQSSTQTVRNARMEGSTAGVLGSGGVLPTNFSLVYGTAGLSLTVVGTGTEAGIPYVDLRYSGTATADGFPAIFFETLTQIAAANGQTWTGSAYLRVSAGSLANVTGVYVGAQFMDNVGAQLNYTQTLVAPTTAGLATQRVIATPTAVNAATTNVAPFLTVTFSNATNVDVTLRLGGPMLEQTAAATSLLLPAVASPATVTRASDTATISGSAFAAIWGTGAPTGFMLADFNIAAANGLSRYMFEFNDGTGSNRFSARLNATNSALLGETRNAGVLVQTTLIGFSQFATTVRVGLRWNAAGLDVSYNGSAPVNAAQAKPFVDRVVLGNNYTGGSSLAGRLVALYGGTTYPTTAKFQAASTNGANVATALA